MFRQTWLYGRGQRRRLLLTYLLLILSNLVDLTPPLIFGLLLNRLQTGGETLARDVVALLLVNAALPFFFWMFHGNGRVLELKTSYHVVKNFTDDMYSKISSLPLAWHKNHHTGDTIDRLRKAAQAIGAFSEETFMIISTLMRFLVTLTAVTIFAPMIGLVSLGICLIIFATILWFDKRLIRQIQEVNRRDHAIATTLHDYLTNIVTVITLRIETLSRSVIGQRLRAKYEPYTRQIVFNEVKWFSISMLLTTMSFLIMSTYILQLVQAGSLIMIGTVTMLFQYVERLNYAFFDFAWQYGTLVRRHTDLKAVNPILEAYASQTVADRKESPRTWKKIKISNLNFTYEDEDQQTQQLRDIKLTLERGRKLAFVGESGSGKSTLMLILRGLFSAQQVQVDIDGWTTSDLRVLSGYTTLIPQDPEIFDNTIEYNITAGIPAREEDVSIAAEIARFNRVIERLPRGLQTHVMEKGVNLSGGEKQRLALARGIFAAADSSLILLDEPTSSVDPVNEVAIYKQLIRHFAGRCLVSSIHKLHLLPLFDRIYVFSRGCLVEQGSFHDLLLQQGELSKMWKEYQVSRHVEG